MKLPVNLQPQLESQSRQKEESQIVVKWLGRVNECLAEQSPDLFEKATRQGPGIAEAA